MRYLTAGPLSLGYLLGLALQLNPFPYGHVVRGFLSSAMPVLMGFRLT